MSSGSLEVRLKLDAKSSKMWVFVIKATLEMTTKLSKQTLVQIHLTVLPNKKIRFRTRPKPIDNAMFAEEFFCKVSPGSFSRLVLFFFNFRCFCFYFHEENIQIQGLRFRLYTSERFKREKLLAEAIICFGSVNLEEDMCKIIPFQRAYVMEKKQTILFLTMKIKEEDHSFCFFSHLMIQIWRAILELIVFHHYKSIVQVNLLEAKKMFFYQN